MKRIRNNLFLIITAIIFVIPKSGYSRYYHSVIGRWISRDPLVGNMVNPKSLNRYVYCYNNPLIYTDKFGLFVIKRPKKKEKILFGLITRERYENKMTATAQEKDTIEDLLIGMGVSKKNVKEYEKALKEQNKELKDVGLKEKLKPGMTINITGVMMKRWGKSKIAGLLDKSFSDCSAMAGYFLDMPGGQNLYKQLTETQRKDVGNVLHFDVSGEGLNATIGGMSFHYQVILFTDPQTKTTYVIQARGSGKAFISKEFGKNKIYKK